MARKGKLSCLGKRDLLNRSAVAVDTLQEKGEQYEEVGLFHDAIDLYAKAGAKSALQRLLEVAVEEGDWFMFKGLCRSLQREPTPEECLKLAEKAEALGKHAFAVQANREAGVETEDEQVVSEEDS